MCYELKSYHEKLLTTECALDKNSLWIIVWIKIEAVSSSPCSIHYWVIRESIKEMKNRKAARPSAVSVRNGKGSLRSS